MYMHAHTENIYIYIHVHLPLHKSRDYTTKSYVLIPLDPPTMQLDHPYVTRAHSLGGLAKASANVVAADKQVGHGEW